MTTTRHLTAACACLFAAGATALLSAPAAAEDRGWYSRAYVGINGVSADDLTLTIDGTSTNADADFSASFTGGGSLGFRYNDKVRVEAGIIYRTAEVDKITFDNGGAEFTEGDYSSLTLDVIGYYDFDALGANGAWTPYVGGGLSYIQEVDIDFEDASGETSFETDDIGFTALAGLRYEPSGPWWVDTEVRYLTAGEIDMDSEEAGGGTVSADYDALSLNVGFGYRF